MYTLVLFFTITSQWHTDVNSFTLTAASEPLCRAAAGTVIGTLNKAYPSVEKIEWSCVKTGN